MSTEETVDTSQSATTRPARPRLWKRLLLALIALLLGLLLLALWLVGTESGTRQLFNLATRLVPGELSLEQQHGKLGDKLSLVGLHYRDNDLILQIDRLELQWQPAKLLQGRLLIDHLTSQGLALQLPPAEPQAESQPESGPFTGVQLPLAIELKHLDLRDTWIRPSPSADPIVVNRVHLAAQAGSDKVDLEQLLVEAFDARVDADGAIAFGSGLAPTLSLTWQYNGPDDLNASGRGRIDGTLAELQIEQNVAVSSKGAGILGANLAATLRNLEQEPGFSARIDLLESNLAPIAPDFPATAQGELALDGTLVRQQASGVLQLQSRDHGPLQLKLELGFDGKALDLTSLQLSNPDGARLSATGNYQLEPEPAIDARLDWQALRWPLQGGAPQVASQTGKASIKGPLSDYRYQLNTAFAAPELPDARIEATGQGSLEGLARLRAVVDLPSGRASTEGQVAWSPQTAADLVIETQGIDPAQFDPAFPGSIDLLADLRLRQPGKVIQAGLKLRKLQGQLRDYPLSAKGELALKGDHLTINDFQLNSGTSRVTLGGQVADKIKLDWSLDANQLETLWPGLAGSLKADGTVAGDRSQPRLQASIDGADIAYQQNRLARISGELDLQIPGDSATAARKAPVKLSLAIQQLDIADQRWQDLSLNASGNPAEHLVELQLRSKTAPTLETRINAGLDRKNRWNGSLQQLDLGLHDFGDWRLRRATAFSVDAGRQQLEQLCLYAEQGNICLAGANRADSGWQAEMQAEQLNLKLLQPVLPTTVDLKGTARLTGQFSGDPSGRIKGGANLVMPEAQLPVELAGKEQRFEFSGSEVTAKLDQAGAELSLMIPVVGLGELTGDIGLPGFDPVSSDVLQQPLKGRLQGGFADLSWIGGLNENVREVSGRLSMDFSLAGQIGEPRLRGSAQLSEGGAEMPALGLVLKDIQLQAQAPQLDRVTYTGSLHSGDGQLALTGETRLNAANGFPTSLRLQGEDLQIINVAEAEVHLSPDLNISHNGLASRVEGEIVIPFARLRPRSIPKGAVSASPDMVLVETKDQGQDVEQLERNFSASVRVVFGDRVNFDGLGLRTPLAGDLLLIDEPGRPVFGRGRIDVTGGTYRAYGQDLTIERGNLLFADTTVDNPGLDIRAVRQVEDVTAGIKVSGTLKKPSLKVFSEPAMTQSEALSYLVLGRAPSEGGGGNGNLTAALAAAGAGEAATELGRQLGLDELRLETEGTLSGASVVAGTYLNPKLYVQYVNSLATREPQIRVRYDLTDQLQIQSETGKAQGLDLFYKIER